MIRMKRTRASGSCPALGVSDPPKAVGSAGTGSGQGTGPALGQRRA